MILAALTLIALLTVSLIASVVLIVRDLAVERGAQRTPERRFRVSSRTQTRTAA